MKNLKKLLMMVTFTLFTIPGLQAKNSFGSSMNRLFLGADSMPNSYFNNELKQYAKKFKKFSRLPKLIEQVHNEIIKRNQIIKQHPTTSNYLELRDYLEAQLSMVQCQLVVDLLLLKQGGTYGFARSIESQTGDYGTNYEDMYLLHNAQKLNSRLSKIGLKLEEGSLSMKTLYNNPTKLVTKAASLGFYFSRHSSLLHSLKTYKMLTDIQKQLANPKIKEALNKRKKAIVTNLDKMNERLHHIEHESLGDKIKSVFSFF